jgi:hypothetical protein
MRTEDLIRALAADNATRAASVERWLAAALLCALVISGILFVLMLGPRADLSIAASQFGFWFKFLVTLMLATSAAHLVAQLVKPGADTTLAALSLAAAPLLIAAVVAAEFAQLTPSVRMMKAVGSSWRSCLTFIPLLSVPILFAALLALRRGAATRPALAGAVAGLLAGGLGAAVYASYCPEDSALFLATWYSLAIAIVALAGAAIGSRWLRW